MATRIGIVNYGMGNLRSVEKALERVGAEPVISGRPGDLDGADGLVLPGVGAFPKAMTRIRESGLDDYLESRAAAGTPLLGVCLGMQLLFESSEENEGAEGLGLLPGPVTRLKADGLKLPHIGWSPLSHRSESPLMAGTGDGEPFYFVHTFVPRPAEEHCIATADYGERFAAVVGFDGIWGAQFHPEKSSASGLRMLGNFAAACTPAGASADGATS